jgi:hypothetical protein
MEMQDLENENKYYVYMHLYPGTDEPFYVGKGYGQRAYHKGRNSWWKNIVAKYGGFDVKFIKTDITDNEARLLETELIKSIGRRDLDLGPLVNLTDGGEGGSSNLSQETRDKLSASSKGRKHTEETKQRMRDSATGKPKSEEHRKNIGKVHLGKTLTEDHRKKISNGNKGVTHKDKGTPMNEEHKLIISNALKGRVPSEEHRLKLSEAAKAAHRRKKEGL